VIVTQVRERGIEMANTTNDRPARTDADAPVDSEQLARQQAIKQIERGRHYWITTAIFTVGMLVLATIWAITEYHNAGGWPAHGFSQSSGIHDVWNIWIIYPAIAWAFLTIAVGLGIYLRRPISESQIKREIERQSRPAH
jgi:hypothetical protein